MKRIAAMTCRQYDLNERCDIFSGSSTLDVVCVERVIGLEAAKEVMRELAAQSPGFYFVYCVETQEVVSAIDTLHTQPSPNFCHSLSGSPRF
jgi:hypothetical protein